MQYYINLSSVNNFEKITGSSSEPRANNRPTMVDGQLTGGQQQDEKGSKTSTTTATETTTGSSRPKRRKAEKSVRFSEDSPKTLNRLAMELANSNNVSSSGHTTPDDADEEGRQFDVVIFAASGCVGRFLVEEMALVAGKHFSGGGESNTGSQANNISPPSRRQQQQQQFAQQTVSRRRSVPSSSMADNEISWAVAGRSAVRLSETLCRAELSTGIKGLSNSVPVLLADLNHQRSLADMCQKARIVINCAGPYSELAAEILIQTCIETKTHYIDLAHEVTFVETIRQRYSSQARESGVFILNGCGFQSMSAEMGLNFTKQVADGTIEQIKIILSLSDTSAIIKSPSNLGKQRSGGIISEGMWSSLLAEKTQEISVEDRLRAKASKRDQQAYQLMQEQQVQEQQEADEERAKLLRAADEVEAKQVASAPSSSPSSSSSTLQASTSARSDNSNRVQSKLTLVRPLERKDTQSLVKDILQFRNRNVPLAWPLRLIQGFQGKSGRGYCWPIDNLSSDESQLIRSEMNNYELRRPDLDSDEGWRPIRCSTFLSVKNFTQLSLLFVWIFLFQLLVKFSPFRYAMRKFPHLITFGHVVPASSSGSSSLAFSLAGGSGRGLHHHASGQQAIERDSLSHIKFCQTFIAYGMPSDDSADPLETRRDKHSGRRQVQLLVSRVVGPEPNHVATATFAIQAAMTLLAERDHLPSPGGVLTPGAAFSETNIIYQLRKRNIKFEVLKKA